MAESSGAVAYLVEDPVKLDERIKAWNAVWDRLMKEEDFLWFAENNDTGKAIVLAWIGAHAGRPAFTDEELKLLRRSVSQYGAAAHSAANHYAQKGPQSSQEKMLAALDTARKLDALYNKLAGMSVIAEVKLHA